MLTNNWINSSNSRIKELNWFGSVFNKHNHLKILSLFSKKTSYVSHMESTSHIYTWLFTCRRSVFTNGFELDLEIIFSYSFEMSCFLFCIRFEFFFFAIIEKLLYLQFLSFVLCYILRKQWQKYNYKAFCESVRENLL